MISAASIHSFAERKTKNLLNIRSTWFKKEESIDSAMDSTAVTPKLAAPFSSLSSSKVKVLSRSRARELLNSAMIRLMERMIEELFPCVTEGDVGSSFANSDIATNGPLPNFEEFLKHICCRTRTQLTCMSLALLYLTRLRANHPRSRGSPGSSYRLALSSLCVATKYLYDDAYHTCSWVQVSMGLFTQREVNQMEMEFMYFLHYQLGVTSTEWNQWIATLEAKLVSRWQEKGKADTIYGFGLFLSRECCEPNAQDAVRDIAWGEGGKNLLTLLNNAIQNSNNIASDKCSPSVDSAVSDTTCLPTPDPNGWFRIRSPVLQAGQQSAVLSSSMTTDSNPITPNTAHFSDTPCLNDKTSAYPQQAHHFSTHASIQTHVPVYLPEANRPMPMPTNNGGFVQVGRPESAMAGSMGSASSFAIHRHTADAIGFDWDVTMQRQPHPPPPPPQASVPLASSMTKIAAATTGSVSGSADSLAHSQAGGFYERPYVPQTTMCASDITPGVPSHADQGYSSYSTSSPMYSSAFGSEASSYPQQRQAAMSSNGRFDFCSRVDGLPATSLKMGAGYAGDMKKGCERRSFSQSAMERPPSSIQLTNAQSIMQQQQQHPVPSAGHYYTAPRSVANPTVSSTSFQTNSGATEAARKNSQHRLSTLAKLVGGSSSCSSSSGNGAVSVSRPSTAQALAPQSSSITSTATIISRNSQPAAGTMKMVQGSDTRGSRPVTACAVSQTAHASGASPPLEPHITAPRCPGHSGSSTAAMSVSTPGNQSTKSSVSSSASISGRRISWRQHGRYSTANLAQKLRSLAAFNWSSGGPNIPTTPQYKQGPASPVHNIEEEEEGADSCGRYRHHDTASLQDMTICARSANPKHHSYCPTQIGPNTFSSSSTSQTMFSRKAVVNTQNGRQASLKNVKAAFDCITSAQPPSTFEFEYDVDGYVAMKS